MHQGHGGVAEWPQLEGAGMQRLTQVHSNCFATSSIIYSWATTLLICQCGASIGRIALWQFSLLGVTSWQPSNAQSSV
jgi:hypothetical protein